MSGPEMRAENLPMHASAADHAYGSPVPTHFPAEGDEKMQASKLITISTIAVLMGGTSFAIGQGGLLQQGGGTAGQGMSQRGSPESGRFNPRAAERSREITGARGQATATERGHAFTGERGRVISGERSREIAGERGRAMSTERGRAITGERGQAIAGERSRALRTERGRAMAGQEPGAVYGSTRGVERGLSAEQRMRLRDILETRRDIPRVSMSERNIRVGAFVPRGVRMAPVPQEVVRLQPRFRGNRVFFYRDEIVIVDPATLRIIAVLPT
jgi:uncharacterized protein DUF1236